MEHSIAGVVAIREMGQSLASDDEMRLNIHLDAMMAKISACANVHAAKDGLDELGRFQTDLATACFKWKVNLPTRLRTLVRQFDRSDDPEIRSSVFDSIRAKRFCVPPDRSGGKQS